MDVTDIGIGHYCCHLAHLLCPEFVVGEALTARWGPKSNACGVRKRGRGEAWVELSLEPGRELSLEPGRVLSLELGQVFSSELEGAADGDVFKNSSSSMKGSVWGVV